MRLRVGISPCPNDTFAFHGLLTNATDRHGLDLDFSLLDIQELNERLVRGELHAGKASFAQASTLTKLYGVLPVGAAIGFGVGPLLVTRDAREPPDAKARVLCPGAGTTATLLMKRFFPQATKIEQVDFASILPMVKDGAAEFGVLIHEGRFTFAQHGLVQFADLGDLWEKQTHQPLPLGGLLARHDLGGDVHRRLTAAVRDSLDHAHSHRESAFATMQRHAQELDASAIWRHVELYVNDATRELGPTGLAALKTLERAVRDTGGVPRGAPPLSILGS